MKMTVVARLLSAFLCIFAVLRPALAEDDPWGSDYLPDATVLTQDGKPLKFYSDVIKGKLTVISFIYTTCRDICPLVTARLADIQRRLGPDASHGIQFVSISIDPETDTPERMKAHADAFGVQDNWLFLTGTRETIDLIRYKLGERSRTKTEHRSEILIRNDVTGEWSRDSVFGDMETVATNIRAMDPKWRAAMSVVRGDQSAAAGSTLPALPGQALFARACSGCHTVGKGSKVGPDLKDVGARRPRPWLEEFLANPEAMRKKNDAVARELSAQYPGVRMPALGLSPQDIDDLLAFVGAQSHADTLAQQVEQNKQHDHAHGHH